MGEGIDRMKEWFGRALRAADFDLNLNDKTKGSSWKEATPLSLFNRMMGHVNKMMDSNPRLGQVHAIKVVNYALMVATKLVDEDVPIEAEPEKIVLREVIYPHSGHTESPNVEWGPPIIAGEDESDPIVETGRPPLDLGPLPNGPAKEAFSTAQADTAGDLLKADLRGQYEPNGSEDASYYCPWCEHTAKLAAGCRGKICCIKCGKPINSRMGKLLKKARENHYVESKMAVNAQELARDLGTTASWAGQVMRALGWTRNANWSGKVSTWYTPPREDGK